MILQHVFWVVLCGILVVCQRFREHTVSIFRVEDRGSIFSKMLHTAKIVYSRTTQENSIYIHITRKPQILCCNMLFKLLWIYFRDASRELVLAHVKEHYQQRLQQASSSGVTGSNDTAEASVRRGHALFRCGHCHQVSNWKHVIQVQLTTFTANCMGWAVCEAWSMVMYSHLQ